MTIWLSSEQTSIVDPLAVVEVRNWVLKELKADISIVDILSPLPIHSLALKISEGSKIVRVSWGWGRGREERGR
jgi:hypothetical protein